MVLPRRVAEHLDALSSPSNELRIVEAANDCVCKWGWGKTTIDDIASAAGVSRATVYRTFPGGRASIYDAVRRHGVLEFFGLLEQVLAAGETLFDTVVDTIVCAATELAADEPLAYQLIHEPGEVLQTFSFGGLDRLLAASRIFVAPHLLRFVERQQAARVAEWATRVVLSYHLEPSATVDLSRREDTAALVQHRLPVAVASSPTITSSLAGAAAGSTSNTASISRGA